MAPPVGFKRVLSPVQWPHVALAGGKLPTARPAVYRRGKRAPFSAVMEGWRRNAEYARSHVRDCRDCRARLLGQVASKTRVDAWLAGAVVYGGARCHCGSTSRRVRDGSCNACWTRGRRGRVDVMRSKSGRSLDSIVARRAEAADAARMAALADPLKIVAGPLVCWDRWKQVCATGTRFEDGRIAIRLTDASPVNGVFGVARVLVDDPHFERFRGRAWPTMQTKDQENTLGELMAGLMADG